MIQQFPLAIVAVLLLLVSSTWGQEEPPRSDDVPVAEIPFHVALNQRLARNKFGMEGKVERELAILQNFTKLNDATINELLAKLEPVIKKTRSRYSKLIGLSMPADQILNALDQLAQQECSVSHLNDIQRKM